MISCGMKEVADLKRYSSPTVTPQALALMKDEGGGRKDEGERSSLNSQVVTQRDCGENQEHERDRGNR
jgi:hypothetical protein